MNVIDQLKHHVVVAVVRAPSVGSAMNGVAALVRGGIRAIEITYSTPDAAKVIGRLRTEYGDEVVVGAGTVLTVEQVTESVDAEAAFLVSPGVHGPTAAAMRATGVPFALGVLTPTEVMSAVAEGADVVKLFPGSLGGPGYLKALRGPFPEVLFMPTGGVSVENVDQWRTAGAICLGAGSDLVSAELLDRGEYAEITRRARAFCRAVEPEVL